MNKEKTTELSKKKKAYVQNFINWITQQPENIVYNITNKLGELKMKQKKQKDITLELIYKELTGFITRQEAFNEEIKKDIVDLKTDVAAIKSCPTIKRELEML